jgi:hypothetical protein
MALANIDPILLGHNSFFGVNHLSSEAGAAREAQFEDTGRILEIINVAMDNGVRAMMMSTHPRAALIADTVRKNSALIDRLNFYPLLPYIAKYVRQSNEKGLVNVVLDQIKGAGIGQTIGLFARGGMAVLRKDVSQILKTLIHMELMPLRGLRMRAVFLHDVLTDLAMALDMRSIFELYVEEIPKKFEAEPAFATKNLPMLLQKLKAWGIQKPLILTHFNKSGFQMNPSREACERCLTEFDFQIMAMGTLASGHLKPDPAYEYLFKQPRMDSLVVGVSTADHAKETFDAVRRYSKKG